VSVSTYQRKLSHTTIGIHFPPALLERVRQLAASTGTPFNRWVVLAVKDAADLEQFDSDAEAAEFYPREPWDGAV
jgi:hypothetical protein